MEQYPDTEKGCRDLLSKMYDKSYFNPDIIDPDPHAPFVWLAIDTKKKMAVVVYLNDNDVESVNFQGIDYKKYLA